MVQLVGSHAIGNRLDLAGKGRPLMARLRGTLRGTRGQVSRLGTSKSGLVVMANGWNVGVRVEVCNSEVDCFHVFATGGSNRSGGDIEVGSIFLDGGIVTYRSKGALAAVKGEK